MLVKSPIKDPLKLEFDDEFYKNSLFLIGEFHEFAASPTIDVAMFKHLHEKKIFVYIWQKWTLPSPII